MAEKPEVLDAVLKETVDLVIRSEKFEAFFGCFICFFGFVYRLFVNSVSAGKYTHRRGL